MIAKLLKLDPAVRALPACAAGAVAITVLHERLVAGPFRDMEFIDAGEAPTDLVQIGLIGTLLMIAVIAVNGIRTRASEFQLSQPVSARTWIKVRILALCALGWGTFGASAATGALAIDSALAREAFLVRTLSFTLAWTSWIVLHFVIEPASPRLSSAWKPLLVSVAGILLAFVSQSHPDIGIAFAIVLIGLGAWALAMGVPERMLLESPARAGRFSPEAKAAAQLEIDSRRAMLRRPLLVWILRRTVLKVPVLATCIAIAVIVIILWGSSTSGLVFAVLMPVWLASVFAHSLQVLREVGHLPVSRRRLAPWVLLPGLVALASGVLIATFLWEVDPEVRFRERVDLVLLSSKDSSKQQTIRVPGYLTELVWGQDSVVVTAPSGETAELLPTRLLPGLPLAFLNPYGFGPDSSREFVAWQLARAVHDAYGVDADPAELDAAYLSVLEGRVIAPFFGQRFLRDYGDQDLDRPHSFAFVGLLCAWLFWALSGWYMLRSNTPLATERAFKRSRIVGTAFLLGVLVLLLATIVLPLFIRNLDGIDRPDLRFALAGLLDRSPLGTVPLMTLTFLVLVVGSYLVLEKRFQRLEIPPALPKPWAQQRWVAPVEAVNLVTPAAD